MSSTAAELAAAKAQPQPSDQTAALSKAIAQGSTDPKAGMRLPQLLGKGGAART